MKKSSAAFTLLELLIVLVIIGIVIAAASLMLSSAHRGQTDLKTAINLFYNRTVLAQQEATLSTSTLGVSLSAQGYQFYRYVEILPTHQWVWKALEHDKALNFHAWPSNTKIELAANQKTTETLGDNFPTTPQIMFYPSNQITPFTLIADEKFQIIGLANGIISVGDYHA